MCSVFLVLTKFSICLQINLIIFKAHLFCSVFVIVLFCFVLFLFCFVFGAFQILIKRFLWSETTRKKNRKTQKTKRTKKNERAKKRNELYWKLSDHDTTNKRGNKKKFSFGTISPMKESCLLEWKNLKNVFEELFENGVEQTFFEINFCTARLIWIKVRKGWGMRGEGMSKKGPLSFTKC